MADGDGVGQQFIMSLIMVGEVGEVGEDGFAKNLQYPTLEFGFS